MSDARIATPPRSLRVRLLWGTVIGVALALIATGVALTTLFRTHVISQFQSALSRQMDQLIVELEFDAAGRPQVDDAAMLDLRLRKQYSGMYWQIDELPDGRAARTGVLRSRSLWDSNLSLSVAGATEPGPLVVGQGVGPAGESLLILQRVVTSPDAPGRRFRLIVAGNLRLNNEATNRFSLALAAALALLLILLALAAWAQVSVGLKPLRDLQAALKAVRDGRTERLEGVFPQEVQPLVDDFNQVLTANAEVVSRARTQAGNLAHALKTPIAVLENEADRAAVEDGHLPVDLVKAQLSQVRRHVDWHLSLARAAASRGLPGRQTDVVDTLAGLLRVLERVFVDKQVHTTLEAQGEVPRFAGESQDLQEILGNLLENAFKWARAEVSIHVDAVDDGVRVCIEDDGPGIEPAQWQAVRQRGVRLDESTPGSGLGLAIVQDLVQRYDGAFDLENRQGGGLRAVVRLPRHAPAA
ncbi:MAG: sensor histidine kinase [Rhodocyclaceae bacterium]